MLKFARHLAAAALLASVWAAGPGMAADKGGLINNSETDVATVRKTAPRPKAGEKAGLKAADQTPVNGIGGTGGGRYTFKPTTRPAGIGTGDTSNRDHIDQDAQSDIKK